MIASFLALLGAADAQAQALPDFTGCWKNELGSRMQIEEVETGGVINGSYWTAVGNVSPQTANPLTGYQSSDVIGFCVRWKPAEGQAQSIACFTGQHTVHDGVEHIHTSWLLNRDIKDLAENAELWSANLTGSNDFALVSHTACK